MVENTSRLRFSKELLPRLPGSDEIAQLDLAFHDMADQVKANEQMKRAYIAMFRDELAKPLNEVRSSVAQISAELPPEGAKIVRTTDRNLSRLIGIIGDLTGIEDDTAAPLKLAIKTTPILEVVETAIESVKSFATAHDVKIESKCEQHEIEADGDRLVQILVNFLSNASKFSPKHSVVTVSTEERNDKLRIAVTDQGRGIPAEKQKSIFQKFKQADASDGQRGVGTGLGLSICKQIAELHGGEVGVDSKEGEGSTFWIELPLKREAAAGER
jgi:signal transduction histidine kinase